ncbi:MAG: endonuclease domain-containing protein [Candidatus Marinimicrobia bacterium]|nr:endonuclease domain-containing protein [Candidatus Neomarinimicrobiota bacterium]
MKIHYNPKLKKLARNLRNNSTLSEVLLWQSLKKKQVLGYQFSRQRPIGDYIVDFYCSKLMLVIEIDGSSHEDKYEYDVSRQKYLERLGLSVIRFDDKDIKNQLHNVLSGIENWILENTK